MPRHGYVRKTAHKKAPRTAFKKGDPRINRKGRKKGVPNKFTGELKQLILDAAANAHPGGPQAYLTQQAKRNSRSFLTLLGRILPTKIGNEDDKPFQLETINRAQAGLANLDDTEMKQFHSLLKKIGMAP